MSDCGTGGVAGRIRVRLHLRLYLRSVVHGMNRRLGLLIVLLALLGSCYAGCSQRRPCRLYCRHVRQGMAAATAVDDGLLAADAAVEGAVEQAASAVESFNDRLDNWAERRMDEIERCLSCHRYWGIGPDGG